MGKSLLAAGVLALGCCAYAAGISVRDFGAKGDGVSDDTEAIRRAVTAAETRRVAMSRVEGGKVFYAEHLYCDDSPIVDIVFPEGDYAVTGTVFFGKYTVLRGLGRSRIVQRDPQATTFFFYRVNQARLENLTFVGGKVQLDFSSLNSEGCNLQLRDCMFERSAGPAVKSISWKLKGEPNDRNVGEYAQDAVTGKFVPDERYRPELLARQNNSTLMVVDGCTFERCARAADYACDGSVWRNCRILTPRDMVGGAIRVTNRIHVFGLEAVVDRDPRLRQSVFEVTSSFEAEDSSPLVFIEDSSFRTVDGSGVCTVESTTVPCYRSSTIVVRNCDTESAGCPEGAIVHVAKGTTPNLVSVIGCRERGKGTVKAIRYEREPTPEEQAKLVNYSHLPADRQYRYCVAGNSSNVDTDLGPWIGGHSADYFTGPDARPPVAFKRPRPPAGRVIFAADEGVVADSRTDVTEKLRSLLRKVAREKDVCVVLPAGYLKVTDTVEAGGALTLAAEGMAAFEGLSLDKWFFRVSPGAKVAFRNIVFLGGRGAICYDAQSSRPTGVLADNCRSYGPGEAAFRIVSRGFPRAAKFKAVNGMSYASTLYCGNADATIDAVWFRLLPSVEDAAAPMPEVKGLVNLDGGRLVFRDGLGVPLLAHFRLKDGVEVDPNLKKEEYRWIDNHGEFYSQCTRYGGERGGVAPVFNYGTGPVCIEGEQAMFWANNMQRSAIVNDGPDADCRIFDVVFPAETMWLPRIDPAWRKGPGAPLEYYPDSRPVCIFPVSAP